VKIPKRHYICPLPDGNYRDSTPEEIALAFTLAANIKTWEKQIKTEDSKAVCRELLAKIKAVKEGCKHTVCYDEDGFLYYPRTCVQCGWGTLI